jgi:sugar phosphate isomerase/epimerase
MVLDPKMRAYERALNPALHGCETFDFAPADLCALRERVRAFTAFSVHSPLPTPPDYPGRAVTSFLLDPDPLKRRASLDMLRHTILVAAEWGALYVVVHFAGLHSDGLSRASVLDLADDTAVQLNAWAEQVDLPLHLEYAAYNPSFATPQDLIASVSRHPYLHICLDVGHVRVGAEILGIDEWDVVRMLAPYTASMHLWTTRGREDVRRYHHVPVHPSLTPADGWIDVPGMLEVVLTHHSDCAIVFEPNTLYTSDLDWQAKGVAWVRGLVVSHRGIVGQPAGSPLETRVAGGPGTESPDGG